MAFLIAALLVVLSPLFLSRGNNGAEACRWRSAAAFQPTVSRSSRLNYHHPQSHWSYSHGRKIFITTPHHGDGRSDGGGPTSSPPSSGTSWQLRAARGNNDDNGGGGRLDKGFNLLETASNFIPQGRIVGTVKESWKFGWKRMMAELAPQDKTGSYKRPSYKFGGKIGSAEFPDEAGRYHVYVGNPCPWCHRVRLVIATRNITPDEVGVTQLIDDPVRASRGGWVFGSRPNQRDPLGSFDLRELYDKLSPNFKGRCTAPLLVDLRRKKIVSNESSDIVRMLGQANFGAAVGDDNERRGMMDLYPPDKADEIDKTNAWVYELLNNGVYRCGFSTSQRAYDDASDDVRRGLRMCEEVLSRQPYLCGESFTEADLRLLPTILRYDGAYAPLFRAGGAHLRVANFPHLFAWLKKCWNIPGVKDSIDLEDANASYYRQLFPLNAGGLIPTAVTAADLGLE